MSPPAGARDIVTFVLDTGALIALEKASPFMTRLLMEVRAGTARVIVPDAVLAQAWRTGSGRQARIATLISLRPEQCTKVPLDTDAARRIGSRVASSGHSDVVDVHAAVTAEDLGAAVITADRADMLAVSPALADRIIDI